MSVYIPNRQCRCQRCRARGLMGASILITLGVLFLLQEFGIAYIHQTWPVILIVIGMFLFASRNASIEGHIHPYSAGVISSPPPPPPPPPQSNPEVKP